MRDVPVQSGGRHLFELVNRDKRSMTLNLKTTEGQAILLRLAARSDVLLQGFLPAVVARLGLQYETLRPCSPQLVYVSVSGYGQSGPFHERSSHDLSLLAASGLLDLMGAAATPPTILPIPLADLAAALWTTLGVIAALLQRSATGMGQHLDVSLLDSTFSLLALPLAEMLARGRDPQRGNLWLSGGQACYHVYETADSKHVALAALEPHIWQAFCMAVGREEWSTRQGETSQSSLIADVAALFRGRTREQWAAVLAEADCCCEPVLTVSESIRHPQVDHRQMFRDGVLLTPFAAKGASHSRAPRLGQHTEEILAELGYAAAQVALWRDRGIV